MTDREAVLRSLVADLRSVDAVADAFLATSFTDRLVILDVRGDDVPDTVAEQLAVNDLHPAEAVYEDAESGGSAVGPVADADRHHFVDVRTRGDHQSYVVE